MWIRIYLDENVNPKDTSTAKERVFCLQPVILTLRNLVSRISHLTAMRDPGNEVDNAGDSEFYGNN